MKIDVKKNAKRNIIFGLANKIVLLFFPFFIKAFINTYLGSEYLGLNSLFTSILSVLSLTELGISSALVYHMYKPIAEDDTKKICALLNFYRKTYLVIGIVTSFLGLLLMPLLPSLIKGECPVDINIYIIYLIQLLANCISYFMFGYKQSLLVAYQREDGEGLNVRDWLYVEDHCKAIDLIIHNGRVGEVYNVGGHNEKQNIEIVKIICKELGKPESLITHVGDRKGHDMRYAIDPTKIHSELGWLPETKFEDGIKKTIKWYLENREWWETIISGEYQNYYEKMYSNR